MESAVPETPTPDRPDTTETVYVAQKRISCDGGGGALGHPKVWYDVGPNGVAECGYCDRRFIYDPDKAQG